MPSYGELFLLEYGVPLDTALTINPFNRSITLYHGSDLDLDIIIPNSPNIGNRLNPNVRMSSYWGTDYNMCKKYAASVLLIDNGIFVILGGITGGFVANDSDFNTFIISESDYDKINSQILNKFIYVYTKTVDKEYVGRGQSSSMDEYTIDVPVKPDKKDKIRFGDIFKEIKFDIQSDEEFKLTMKNLRKYLDNPIKTIHPYKYNEHAKRIKRKAVRSLSESVKEGGCDMPSYGELFMQEYGYVTEFKVVGQGLKRVIGPRANEGKKMILAGNRYYVTGKYKEAKRCYITAKGCYEEVLDSAKDIPDDTGWTWLWRLLPPAAVFTVIQIAFSDGDVDTMTRSSTEGRLRLAIKHVGRHIRLCDKQIEKLKNKLENYKDEVN